MAGKRPFVVETWAPWKIWGGKIAKKKKDKKSNGKQSWLIRDGNEYYTD